MIGVDVGSEDTKQFVSALRAGLMGVIAAVRSQHSEVPGVEELFSPATITAALVLSAWDHSIKEGCTPEQFITVLDKFAADLRALIVLGRDAQPEE